jgi:hypothetical protein
LVYVDDGILILPVQEDIKQAITKLQSTFNISIEGTLNDYVGISVKRTSKDEYHLSQQNIINSILKELNFNKDTKVAKTPAHSTKILGPGTGKEIHKADWAYRRIIGKLNFLAGTSSG